MVARRATSWRKRSCSELVGGARRRRRPRAGSARPAGHRARCAGRSHARTKVVTAHHDTSLRKVAGQNGCGAVAAGARNGRAGVGRVTQRQPSPGGRRRAGRDRDGRRPRPARGRGPPARRAARPGHRRAGRARAVRPRRADPAADHRPAPRRRPAGTRPASTTTCATWISGRPRRSSARSGSTSRWSTWPRRTVGCGPCAVASAPPATASSTIRSPTRSSASPAGSDGRRAWRGGRPPRDLAGPDRAPDGGATADRARRPAPRAGRSSSGSTTRA